MTCRYTTPMRHQVNIIPDDLDIRIEMGRWCNENVGTRHLEWKTLASDMWQFRFKLKSDANKFEKEWTI